MPVLADSTCVYSNQLQNVMVLIGGEVFKSLHALYDKYHHTRWSVLIPLFKKPSYLLYSLNNLCLESVLIYEYLYRNRVHLLDGEKR